MFLEIFFNELGMIDLKRCVFKEVLRRKIFLSPWRKIKQNILWKNIEVEKKSNEEKFKVV